MSQSSKALLMVLATLAFSCEEESQKTAPTAEPPASAAPAAPASIPVPPPKPKPKPREDCPEGSSGIGTFEEPCLSSGDSRMMEVKYAGKITDKGPKFSVTNKSDKPILYGSIVAYFYDKKGKQLDVAGTEKQRRKQVCSGNIFAGYVKPGEKIYVFFSCVKKSHVPEGMDSIEAEIRTVGFADETGNKTEFYWKNPDLAPNERPKGGIKPSKKK